MEEVENTNIFPTGGLPPTGMRNSILK